MLVARPPADDDDRALADRVRLRARDAHPEPLTARGADDEDAIAVVHEDTDLHHQLVRQRRIRARSGELHALGPHQDVNGALAHAPPRFHVDPHGAERLERHAPWLRFVHGAGEDIAVADELTYEARARPVVDLERWRRLLQLAVAEDGDAVGHRHGLDRKSTRLNSSHS